VISRFVFVRGRRGGSGIVVVRKKNGPGLGSGNGLGTGIGTGIGSRCHSGPSRSRFFDSVLLYMIGREGGGKAVDVIEWWKVVSR